MRSASCANASAWGWTVARSARTASRVAVLVSDGVSVIGGEWLGYNSRTLPRARGRSHMSAAVPQGHPDRVGFQPEGPPPFTPYIAPGTVLPELTLRAVIVG